jgi:hypothetical protein
MTAHTPSNPAPQVRANRALVSQILIGTLASVAFGVAVPPVSAAFHDHGLSINSSALFAIFFLTQFRFLLGDLMHLQSDEFGDEDSGMNWTVDLFFIIGESVVLIFIASNTSISQSITAHFGFFDLLIFLYGLDVVWLGLIWFLDRLPMPRNISGYPFRRKGEIKIKWAVLNIVLGVLTYSVGVVGRHEPYTAVSLWILVMINVGAFIVDIFVFNYEDLV